MRPLCRRFLWAACCVFTLEFSAFVFAQDSISSSSPAMKYDSSSAVTASADLPDSPGMVRTQEAQAPQAGASTAQPQNQSASQPSAQQSAEQEQKLQRPIGTAAAPAPGVSGITAAQPAGVAIAPAKQKRVRTIVIRVGAILGASAAIGTVIALTEATPSKPPGAH